ncbi:MAG: carbohydrate binding family 9 domain-containing protein, partial [Gemmatimonadaceae bacterium]
MNKVLVCLLALLAPVPQLLTAQNPTDTTNRVSARPRVDSTRVAQAVRRTGEIRLDGILDEPDWQKAPVTSDFTESYPKPGLRSPYQTEVRVLYDDAALYVGIRMPDPRPDSIAAQLARRDASGIYSDWVHLIIDSYHDRRTAFRFTVNPRGVKKDVYTSNDGAEDLNWDAVWEVGTRVDSAGWVAEYRIPLSQLRFGSSAGPRTWGFQVMRDIARTNERDTWSPWTPQSSGFVSRFGDLVGLEDVKSPSRLEILPYVSTKLTRAPGDAADPFFRSTDT